MNTNSIPQTNKIAIRETDKKPNVLYQTQTLGIEFKPNHHSIDTICPWCKHHNTPIYFPKLLKQRNVHGAQVACCQCHNLYDIVIPELEEVIDEAVKEAKEEWLQRCQEGRDIGHALG